MRNNTKVRKLRMESLEERMLLAVIAGGFNSSVEFIASETSYDEFVPIDLGVPSQTGACPCDNPLPAPSILTGDNGYHVSYGLNSHLITWNEIDNATGYELEYVTSNGEWFTAKTTEDHTVVGNLAYGTNVTYRVRALGDSTYGSSDWSATKTFNVCPMDLDGDDFIGPGDYALLSSAWFSTEEDPNWNPSLDIDGDGFVGPGDFSYPSSNWLKDAGDGGLSYPTVEKLTLTIPNSALTVPSIMKDSANLTVRVRVDASQISGIEAGDDIEIFAVGTYENAENDTSENVPTEVTVVFSVSGRDAYKYNSIPATTVTGDVYPFSSITLTCDLSKITWGNNKTITNGQQDVPVVFESDAISGIIDGDVLSFDENDANADVIITAKAHYTNNTNTGDSPVTSYVEIRFTISGPKASAYSISNIKNLSGYVTATPIVWYTGIIPKAYIGALEGSPYYDINHTNPYAETINDFVIKGDPNGKDAETIINSLDGKTIINEQNGNYVAFATNNPIPVTFGYDNNLTDADHDWQKSMTLTGVVDEEDYQETGMSYVELEYGSYSGYPFILTNQNATYTIQNAGNEVMPFGIALTNIEIDGVLYNGLLFNDPPRPGDAWTGLNIVFE